MILPSEKFLFSKEESLFLFLTANNIEVCQLNLFPCPPLIYSALLVVTFDINISEKTTIRHNGLLRPHYAVCIMHDRWLRDLRVQVNGARSVRDNCEGRKW